ncbi:beta-ketoacyl synthase N-terminal-like domain-containing protein [Rhizobium ruizarguesonis]
MKRKVVITSARAIDHPGINADRITPDALPRTATYRIPDALIDRHSPISERLKRKIDGFCRKGLSVVHQTLGESKLLETAPDPARVGIYVGNCLGGWGYIEDEIRALHQTGGDAIGPYVATAWFPAALQGQISLYYGFRGHSKTFSAFDVAGMQAVAYASQAIALDLADAIVCCASEDLSSPYMRKVLEETVAHGWQSSRAFGSKNAGSGAESAVAFVLEERESALARGAPLLCELVGYHDSFMALGKQIGPALSSSIEKFIESERDPLLYILDGRFSREREETARALSDRSIESQMINVSEILGEQFSVGGLVETAIAARALGEKSLSASTFGHSGDRPFHQAVVQRLSARGNLIALGLCAAKGRN